MITGRINQVSFFLLEISKFFTREMVKIAIRPNPETCIRLNELVFETSI